MLCFSCGRQWMTSRRNLEFQIGSKFRLQLGSLNLESFESQSASRGREITDLLGRRAAHRTAHQPQNLFEESP